MVVSEDLGKGEMDTEFQLGEDENVLVMDGSGGVYTI